MKVQLISTEYLGEHKDFCKDEFEELEEYLDSIPWDNSYYSSLFSEVKKALKNGLSCIVEPVGEFDDTTIDFKYK